MYVPQVSIQTKLKQELARHPDLPIPKTYTGNMGTQIRNTGMVDCLKNMTPDIPVTGYNPLPPWKDLPLKINLAKLPASKKECTTESLKQASINVITANVIT